MNKFTQKMMAFMYGRYGVDELYYGLFALWGFTALVNIFAQSALVSIIGTASAVYMLFRFLSKNTAKRRRENEAFLKLWRPVKSWFILQRDKFRDRKTARYRKCPKCKAILKLPNKKGKHTTSCPKCGNKFDVRI